MCLEMLAVEKEAAGGLPHLGLDDIRGGRPSTQPAPDKGGSSKAGGSSSSSGGSSSRQDGGGSSERDMSGSNARREGKVSNPEASAAAARVRRQMQQQRAQVRVTGAGLLVGCEGHMQQLQQQQRAMVCLTGANPLREREGRTPLAKPAHIHQVQSWEHPAVMVC